MTKPTAEQVTSRDDITPCRRGLRFNAGPFLLCSLMPFALQKITSINAHFHFSGFRNAILGGFVAVGTLFLASCASSVPLASETLAPDSDVVVARFLVDIDGLEGEYPGKATGLLPLAVEGVRTARVMRDAAQTLDHPEGSPVKMAFDSIYAVVEANVATVGLRLLPPDTLQGQVPYLVGYPMGSAAEVVASGPFARALEIEIYVEVPDQATGSYSILGTGKARTSGHPEMTLKIRLVDAAGQLLWRDDVRVRSKEKIELNERWLLGIQTRSEGPDASSLPALTQQAIDKLLQRRQAS